MRARTGNRSGLTGADLPCQRLFVAAALLAALAAAVARRGLRWPVVTVLIVALLYAAAAGSDSDVAKVATGLWDKDKFRIAQEAMTNVLRHAKAGHVRLSLHCDAREVRLVVEDDGAGLATERIAGLGLITMRERAEQLDGSLAMETPIGGGTRVVALLPLH